MVTCPSSLVGLAGNSENIMDLLELWGTDPVHMVLMATAEYSKQAEKLLNGLEGATERFPLTSTSRDTARAPKSYSTTAIEEKASAKAALPQTEGSRSHTGSRRAAVVLTWREGEKEGKPKGKRTRL